MKLESILKALGGYAKVASALGSTPKAVYMWTRNGVPHKWHAPLRRLARAKRIAARDVDAALEWRP